MTTLQEMETRLTSLRTQLGELSRSPEPSDDDVILQDTLIAEHDDLEARVKPIRERMAAIARVTEAAATPDNREESVPTEAPTMFMRTKVDPFAELDRVAHDLVPFGELRARSAALIEADEKSRELGHDFAETAYERSQNLGTPASVSKHILLTGSHEYREAFRAYL